MRACRSILYEHLGVWFRLACTGNHRGLQSCVGTRARLGYAAFDVQLRKVCFVTTLYINVCRCVSTHMLYRGSGDMPRVFVSGPRA